jgi:hypothetical protein
MRSQLIKAVAFTGTAPSPVLIVALYRMETLIQILNVYFIARHSVRGIDSAYRCFSVQASFKAL